MLIGSKSLRRGVVAHIYHLGIKGLRQEDCKFEASMDNMARCFLKKIKKKIKKIYYYQPTKDSW